LQPGGFLLHAGGGDRGQLQLKAQLARALCSVGGGAKQGFDADPLPPGTFTAPACSPTGFAALADRNPG
jgi:hypothetical protein